MHRTKKFDAIWCVMPLSAGIPSLITSLLLPNARLVVEVQEGHTTEYLDRSIRPARPLFRLLMKRAYAVSALSKHLVDWAHSLGFARKSIIIPNGVDLSVFDKARTSPKSARFSANTGPCKQLVVTVSRLARKNGVDTAISAMSYLPADCHLLIVGDGPDLEALVFLTKNLCLSDRVHFLGQIPNEEAVEYLNASSVFVRPSRSEGFGTAFLEAMAVGLPVVGTMVGGIPDFLFPTSTDNPFSPNGWAVEPDSPKQLAEVIQEILEGGDEVASRTSNASRMVKNKYSWSKSATMLEELLNEAGGR